MLAVQTKYEVQTLFVYGWENCWTEDDGSGDKPWTFATREEAEEALCQFFKMGGDINRRQYRIVEVKQ